MDNPLLLHRLRALFAVLVCVGALVQIQIIDASGRVVVARTGWVLALIVATYAASGLAVAATVYTLLQREPGRARLWSNVASAFAVVVIVGGSLGWFLGLAVDHPM